MNKQLRSVALLLLCTMLWGMAFIAQSVGMDHIGPFTFQAVRSFLAVLSLLPSCWITDRFKKDGKTFFSRWGDKKLWKAGIFCGIALFVACNLQQLGIVDTDAGKAAFLTSMYIVFVPILGLLLKRKPSKMIPWCVALAVVGLYCLSCVGVTKINTGDLLLLGCAFAFAIQILMVEVFGLDVDPLRLNTVQVLVCAVLSGVVMFAIETPTWRAIGDCWLPLVYAGIVSMGVAYSLQIVGQRQLELSVSSILLSLEAVFAVVFGAMFLQETMTIWEWIGCALMLVAVCLSQIRSKGKQGKRTIHVTAGEILNEILTKRHKGETFIPFNEAMIKGAYTAELFSRAFIQQRAQTHQVSVVEYEEKLHGFLQFLREINEYNEVVLWFGDEPFCQANTKTVLQTLKTRGFQGKIQLNIVEEETGDILKSIVMQEHKEKEQ